MTGQGAPLVSRGAEACDWIVDGQWYCTGGSPTAADAARETQAEADRLSALAAALRAEVEQSGEVAS